MAGWHNWEGVQITTGSSVGRTVLETLWPRVQEVARVSQWPEEVWVSRLLSTMSEAICTAKQTESTVLEQDMDLQNAVKAGEMFASREFHQGVCRFDNLQDAINWIEGHIRRHPPIVRPLPAAVNEALARLADVRALFAAAGPDNRRPAWEGITFDLFVQWLYYSKHDDESSTNVANALISYVCGMCKMGNMTGAWRTSRLRQIRREAQNADLELSKSVVEKVWDFYGSAFPPQANAFGGFFAYIEQQCRAHRMTRLFVTAQQAAEQGCTVINLVADAQRQCDDFHWERFYNPRVPAERAILTELNMWADDFEAMKDNPWIRFSGTSGRSPLMANLGYLAKELLTKAMGQTSVDSYAGLDMGNLTIRHKPWIDRIVRQYVDHLNTPVVGVQEHPIARPAEMQPRRNRRLAEATLRVAPLVFNRGQAGQNQAGVQDRRPPGGAGGAGVGGAPAPNPALDALQAQMRNIQAALQQLQVPPAAVVQQPPNQQQVVPGAQNQDAAVLPLPGIPGQGENQVPAAENADVPPVNPRLG